MMLAPKNMCSVPGSFENETLLFVSNVNTREMLICIMHVHTRESPSEYSGGQCWSTLMYVVLKSLSCLQFQILQVSLYYLK